MRARCCRRKPQDWSSGSRATGADSGRATDHAMTTSSTVCGCINRPTWPCARPAPVSASRRSRRCRRRNRSRQDRRTDRRAGRRRISGGRSEPRAVARAQRDGQCAQRSRLAAAIRGHPVADAAGRRVGLGDAPACVDAAHAAATHRFRQPESRDRHQAMRYGAPARRPRRPPTT